jgi:hypothetical protein
MRVVTLVNGTWFTGLSAQKRRYFLKDLFDMAEEFGWTIRVGGEHYGS